MILVADSGATKTQWCFVQQDKRICQTKSPGISPLFHTKQMLLAEFEELFPHQYRQQVTEVHFYGTGCASNETGGFFKEIFATIFPRAQIFVNSDLLAIVHSIKESDTGIACVLGTGSSSCFYQNNEIQKISSGLGYVLGDEGSGAHLGKLFIADFLNGRLPPSLHRAFVSEYTLDRSTLLTNIYSRPFPSRYLASFAKFLAKNKKDNYIKELIEKSFVDFFERSVLIYEKIYPIHFVGSIAFYFKKELQEVAAHYGFTIHSLRQTPFDDLVDYHQQQLAYENH